MMWVTNYDITFGNDNGIFTLNKPGGNYCLFSVHCTVCLLYCLFAVCLLYCLFTVYCLSPYGYVLAVCLLSI